MRVVLNVDASKAMRLLDKLSGPEVRRAQAAALNDAAYAARLNIVNEQMPRVFDRPTPYIKRSVRVIQASEVTLRSVLLASEEGNTNRPQHVLGPQVGGGQRALKASEVAFRRAGILPSDRYLAPGEAAPLDQYGNVPGRVMQQIISYFRAFSEVGYSANMTARRKAKLQDKRRSEAGMMRTHGVRYFVSQGRRRGNRASHLAAGVWAASGTHDAHVRPVLLFVDRPIYRPRLDFHGAPVRVARERFNSRFRFRMRQIVEARS